ncbi:hypothetical protein Vi05172_g8090 [Venturia inaequalis]|nr:hypothetical protein Vi05172_g8090 [Venturia inaequalis]
MVSWVVLVVLGAFKTFRILLQLQVPSSSTPEKYSLTFLKPRIAYY